MVYKTGSVVYWRDYFFFLKVVDQILIHLFIYLFIYPWLCWVFVSVRGLSPVAASGGPSSSRCAGLSIAASLVAEHGLQMRRLSSCGARAQLLRGMWDPPRPGLEPVSPALAGRLSTTAPPGKPETMVLKLDTATFFTSKALGKSPSLRLILILL